MLVFQGNDLGNVSQNLFDAGAPLKFLELAICACLISHCHENDPPFTPHMAIRISDGRVKIIVPKKWGMTISENANKCFILNNLKLPWIVEISDGDFENLKNRG